MMLQKRQTNREDVSRKLPPAPRYQWAAMRLESSAFDRTVGRDRKACAADL